MGKISQPRAKKASAAKAEKSSCKNQPRAKRSERESIAGEGIRFIARLEKAFIPKLPNRFKIISAKKSTMELLRLVIW